MPGLQEITNVYQYLGGPTGSIGGSSWVESDINIDTYTFEDLTNSGSLSGNNIWREFVRQLNLELYDNGDNHEIINDMIPYYQEEYTDPLNPLDPYIELISKDKGNGNKYYAKLFANGPTYSPINIYDDAGSTANYVQSQGSYWSNYGDIPYFVEIFAVGFSGGTINIPGPSFVDRILWTNNNRINALAIFIRCYKFSRSLDTTR